MRDIVSQIEVRHDQENALSLPANTHQTPLHPSLKRKRSDDEGEVEDAGANAVAAGVDAATKAAEPTSSVPVVVVSSTVQTRRPKRMRRMMSSVLHTATAMTLGAVATWGALAFS